ncbi:MAG: hypothetical protein IIT84_00055 [Oscillospiraceae bacterium]|nr:hypothetical protein [Oscillospiraceae bacterium]MBQ5514062.1 hypothetical protein [Oscillospiraceae bacterium]
MSFSEKYPVSDNMGELKVREDGLFLSFSYTCAKVAEPSRLVICCGENTLSLGIPVPESGVLRLSKRVSLSALRRAGLGRIEKARLVPLSQKPEVSEKQEPIPKESAGGGEFISFASGGKRVYLPVRRS